MRREGKERGGERFFKGLRWAFRGPLHPLEGGQQVGKGEGREGKERDREETRGKDMGPPRAHRRPVKDERAWSWLIKTETKASISSFSAYQVKSATHLSPSLKICKKINK